MQLHGFYIANHPALLSHIHQQMQVKTKSVAAAPASVGLNIQKRESVIVKYNTENNNTFLLHEETLEHMGTFTYMDSIIDERGGSDAEVRVRIGKAKTESLKLKNIWNSKQLSTNIQVKIFITNVKTVSSIVRSRNSESYHNHHQISTNIYKQLSTQDTQCPLTGYYQQQPTMGENKPDTSSRGN
ncbi:unnamed protein product [Schistosoma curassoni]|uniref:DUF6451 domain-containing protein n=1 Tax=Schistosoma curassoni TaxID=6186 RepID=A0A183JE27_9TREM|nr:unnamed protein product [Schistosoma curassoni]